MKASSTSVNAERLGTLAEKTNRKHGQVERAEQQASKSAAEAVKHGVEAGELLLLAKEEVGHGHFTKWTEENFNGTPCRARLYMRLATAADQNRIDPDEVSSLAEAERLLREQDAEQAPGEYEPEVPGEDYGFWDRGAESEKKEPETQEPEPATSNTPPPSKAKKQKPAPDLAQAALDAINDALVSVDGQERVALADQFIARITLLKEVAEPKAATEPEGEFLSLGDPTRCFWYSEIRRPDEIVAFHYKDPEDEEECGVAYPIVDEDVVECEACCQRGEIPPAMRAVLEASS